MPKVCKKLDKKNIDLNTEEDQMSVVEYYNILFDLLEEKLLLNFEIDEKQEFDMTKWIWSGDRMDSEPSIHSID